MKIYLVFLRLETGGWVAAPSTDVRIKQKQFSLLSTEKNGLKVFYYLSWTFWTYFELIWNFKRNFHPISLILLTIKSSSTKSSKLALVLNDLCPLVDLFCWLFFFFTRFHWSHVHFSTKNVNSTPVSTTSVNLQINFLIIVEYFLLSWQ